MIRTPISPQSASERIADFSPVFGCKPLFAEYTTLWLLPPQGRSWNHCPNLSCSYSAGVWPRLPKLDTLHEIWTQNRATWGSRNHNLHFLVRVEDCGRNGTGWHKSQWETMVGQGPVPRGVAEGLCQGRLAMWPESYSWLCSLQDTFSKNQNSDRYKRYQNKLRTLK